MSRHFTEVSSVYRDVRTTDPEPVAQIATELRGSADVKGVDIGCGDGRYDLLLFQAMPRLRLTCVDANAAMLRHAAQLLSGMGFDAFDIWRLRVEDLVLEPGAYRFVCSFNAVHHFDFPDFLRTSRDGLADGGHLFVYTCPPTAGTSSFTRACPSTTRAASGAAVSRVSGTRRRACSSSPTWAGGSSGRSACVW